MILGHSRLTFYDISWHFGGEFYAILCPNVLLRKMISNTALILHTKVGFQAFRYVLAKSKTVLTKVGCLTTLQEGFELFKVKIRELHN